MLENQKSVDGKQTPWANKPRPPPPQKTKQRKKNDAVKLNCEREGKMDHQYSLGFTDL